MGFSEEIAKFAEHAKGNGDLVVRKTVFDIGTRLVNRTPVGDASYWKSKPPPGYAGGHARANWSHSEGELNTKEFKAIDGGAPEANISIRRISRTLKKNAAGKVHFVQNSVPYIQALEDGHSRQAPAGMVAITKVEFQGIITAIAKGLK